MVAAADSALPVSEHLAGKLAVAAERWEQLALEDFDAVLHVLVVVLVGRH